MKLRRQILPPMGSKRRDRGFALSFRDTEETVFWLAAMMGGVAQSVAMKEQMIDGATAEGIENITRGIGELRAAMEETVVELQGHEDEDSVSITKVLRLMLDGDEGLIAAEAEWASFVEALPGDQGAPPLSEYEEE